MLKYSCVAQRGGFGLSLRCSAQALWFFKRAAEQRLSELLGFALQQMGAQGLKFASALNELAGDVNKNAAYVRATLHAPQTAAVLALASVLQTASFGRPNRQGESGDFDS